MFALEIGRIESRESVSTEQSSIGVGSVFLRSTDGSLLATISTRALVEIVASSDPSVLLRKTDPTPMELCSVLTDSLLSILPISNANKVAFSTNEFMLC